MELDFKKLISILLRYLWIIIIFTAIGAIAAFLITRIGIEPKYSASATMYVNNRDNRQNETITSGDIATSQKLVNTYIVILQSDAVMNVVAEKCGLDYTPAQISGMFSASAINSTEVFRITIQSKNPEHAQIIANSFIDVAASEIVRVVKSGAVEIIDKAALPTAPVSPNVRNNTMLGGLLAFMICFAVTIMITLFDTRIRDEEDITNLFEIPIIGYIPLIELDSKREESK